MAIVLHLDIVLSEFEPKSCCYIPFQINTLGEGMNSLILPAIGLNTAQLAGAVEYTNCISAEE